MSWNYLVASSLGYIINLYSVQNVSHLEFTWMTIYFNNECCFRTTQRWIQGVARGVHALPIFSNHLFFCNHFEELRTVFLEVELIINNAPLTQAYQSTT